MSEMWLLDNLTLHVWLLFRSESGAAVIKWSRPTASASLGLVRNADSGLSPGLKNSILAPRPALGPFGRCAYDPSPN